MTPPVPTRSAEESFEHDVLERSHELPVVVDFWAAWCGPCPALTPILERAVADRPGQIELVKVNIDANREAATRGIGKLTASTSARSFNALDASDTNGSVRL